MRLGNVAQARGCFLEALNELGDRLPESLLGNVMAILWAELALRWPRWLSLTSRKRSDRECRLVAQLTHIYWPTAASVDGFRALTQVTRNAVIQRQSNNSATRGLAFSTYAFLSGLGGADWKGKAFRRRAHMAFDQIEDDYWRAVISQNLGGSYFVEGDIEQADRWLQRSLDSLEKMKDWQFSFSLHWLRHLYSFVGAAPRIVDLGSRELAAGNRTHDVNIICWGKYGLADGFSRQGQLGDGIRNGVEATQMFDDDNVSLAIARQELGRALIQASHYQQAAQVLIAGQTQVIRLLAFFEPAIDTMALLAEAEIGPDWLEADRKIAPGLVRRMRTTIFLAHIFGANWPTMKAHAYRVLGRWFWVRKKPRKAIRNWKRACRFAARVGADYEHARGLLDLAAVQDQDRDDHRAKAVELLKRLNSVIPRAESWLLGDQYDESVVAPEFDLEAWERAHGPISPKIDADKA